MMRSGVFLFALLLALAGCNSKSEEPKVEVPPGTSVVADKAPKQSSLAPDVARVVRHLQSTNSSVKRDAAKLACKSYSRDPHVLDVANRELLNGYNRSMTDRHHMDAMAWLCKTLAASGKTQYAGTLRKVAAGTSNAKLIKYAEESLRHLQ